jgi:type I restriction enzyme S subunit
MKVSVLASAQDSITAKGVEESATSVVPKGSILVVARSGILAHTFPVARAGCPVAFNQDIKAIQVASDKVSSEYVYWFLRGKEPEVLSRGVKKGATVHSLQSGFLERLAIPLAPIDEQRRIVDLLSRAENIVRMRREAEAKAKEIIPALFLDMFGDPARNERGWDTVRLGDLAVRMSDGPFGSNLKSSHYVESGVRVIRLQNIGIRDFLDSDEAFVSHKHFATLRKHRCTPGDVLIGALGDPNLRATILPDTIPEALNKADCVQFRCDRTKVMPEYACWLLNIPSSLSMAAQLVQGITRTRISMGRLRELRVPVPPIALQMSFEKSVQRFHELQNLQRAGTTVAFTAFQSLLAGEFGKDARA